ncbi:hypothetical protein [Schleiferilactobacillus perolens]|uniref:Uncharacterized protein n=1 Tax=Schleiferilactobacillus perolens DSM 12744 TaxID=1423792 RepID=A0A0R1N643_9LACO|nr:hypothetical protein [Schleiferilactobacillus perolens]KRL11672.1 hypothetical protein FD09_GL000594 [Schleiferilactobacillus perolens DSM 12744]
MKKKQIKYIGAVAAALLAAAPILASSISATQTPVYAATTADNQAQKAALTHDDYQSAVDTLKGKLGDLDQQIQAAQRTIDDTTEKVQAAQDAYPAADDKVTKAQDASDKAEQGLKQVTSVLEKAVADAM